MIELRHVTKVYGKGKKRTVALSDVSFVLPDSGFVFVVGKSGCGKSTLLNMIGGCDKITSGEIVIDGNEFSAFKERDYDNFRCDHVGFIFQDYCLLEGLTVEQNVALALELKSAASGDAVRRALEKVELGEFADRYPAELSGGQKQRVAIARTLVKRPKLVLADEPTGNLDENSTHIILNILKEISKSTLVVIVSHDRKDAGEYADRIIQLSDGKISGDYSRNPESAPIAFCDGEAVIQKGAVFTEEDIETINKKIQLSEGKLRLRQVDDKFIATTPPTPAGERKAFASDRLSGRGFWTLFWMFAKKRAVGIAVTVVSVVCLIVAMGVCQLFTMFSPDAEIARTLGTSNSSDTLIMQKGYRDANVSQALAINKFVRTTKADQDTFRAAGYNGGIYPLYNVSLMTNFDVNPVWNIEAYTLPRDETNYKYFYCGSGLGVLATDVDYLKKVYGGQDGELTVLSGTLETKDDNIVVTDYFADSVLAFNKDLRSPGEDPYANILNRLLKSRYRIAGVIETGYRERYKPLIDAAKSGNKEPDLDDELYAAFIEEADRTLNIGYSFNPGFGEAYCTDEAINRTVYFGTIEAKYGEFTATSRRHCQRSAALSPGNVYLHKEFCAKLFGIPMNELTPEAVTGKKFTVTRYEYIPQGEPADFTMELTVAGFYEPNNGVPDFTLSFEDYALFKQYGTVSYALYFDELDNITELCDAGDELNYMVRSPLVAAMHTVAKAALVFTDMFKLIVGILLVLAVVTLVAFGVGSVKKSMYDIAVIRALGGKTRDLTLMFVLEMLVVSAICCIISVFGLALGANVCNSILVEGFTMLVKNVFMRKLRVITFNWGVMLIDAAIVLLLTVIAAVVPFFIMHRAKPREIIRAKE